MGNKGLFLLSRCLPADVDEVARRRRLALGVGFEISIDLVLQFAMEGLGYQLLEALQTMRVVGETEFAAKAKQSIKASERPPNSHWGGLFIVSNAGGRQHPEEVTETSQGPLHTLLHVSKRVKSFHTLLTL